MKNWQILVMAVWVSGVVHASKNSDASAVQGLINTTKDVGVKRGGYTQTVAHISVDSVQQKIKQNFSGIAAHKRIIDTALARENQYKRTHDVFYTTQYCSRLLQDLTQELYKRSKSPLGALKNDAFQFLRFEHQNAKYNQFSSMSEFLKKALLKDGVVYDQFDNKALLVPADLSLFGNAASGVNSTWMRFSQSSKRCEVQTEAKTTRRMLEELLVSYGYQLTYIDKLLALNKYLVDINGNSLTDLLQIFVPENIVNEVGYLSWRSAVPYDKEFITELLKSQHIKEQSSREIFQAAVNNFSRMYKHSDTGVKNAVQALIKKVNEGGFNLEQYLYKYRTQPDTLEDLNYVQARLLVTNKVLLNPASGVLMYRYSQIDLQKEAVYKIELERILHQMDIEKQAFDYKKK